MLTLLATVVCCLASFARAQSTQPVTIEIPVFAGGTGTQFFTDTAREFEKLRPDVNVDLYGDPRIDDKVRVRILEGKYFNATNATQLAYMQLIQAGDVQPIDPWLDGPCWDGHTTWRKTFQPGSLDQYTIDGKTYGIPLPLFPLLVWYNKTTFEQHGWVPPKSHSEWLKLCESMKTAGVTPFSFCGVYPYYGEALVQSSYYDTVGKAEYQKQLNLDPGSFDNPQFISALAFAQNLSSHYFQPGFTGMTHTDAQTQFFTSQTAMIPCGAWLKSEMMGKIPADFRLGAFNYPPPDNVAATAPNAIAVVSECFFVMSHAEHVEQTIDFMRFMTSAQRASEFTRQRDIPTAIVDTLKGNLSPDVGDLIPIISAAKESFVTNGQSTYPQIETAFNDTLNKLYTNAATPEQAAKMLEASAQNLRTRAAHPDLITIRHIWQPITLLAFLFLGGGLWAITAISAARKSQGSHAEIAPILSGRGVLLFVAPALAFYTAFVIYPSVRSVSWSMHDWNGITPMAQMRFDGMQNFKRLLFESDAFWMAMGNNLFLMLVVPLFVLPLSLFLAACINRGVWGSNLFRIVFFFPNLLGSVATTLLWLQLYRPTGGLVNGVLGGIGLHSFDNFAWLDPSHLYWALIPLSVWGACGFNMVLYLAAMQNIPESLYEAAELDGATHWQQFWVITMPMIRTVFTISLVFLVIGGMKAFEIIWLLTNQRPVTSNHVVGTLMIQTMFQQFQIGESTAIAVLLFLVVFIGSLITLKLTSGENYEAVG